MLIARKPVSPGIRQAAVRDFAKGDLLETIAARYGVALETVSLWAKDDGQAPRERGRRQDTIPSARDLKVIALHRGDKDRAPMSFREIARVMGGLSRARAHRIWQRWQSWDNQKPAYQMGDMVRLNGEVYRVITSTATNGQCVHVATGRKVTIPWRLGTKRASKV